MKHFGFNEDAINFYKTFLLGRSHYTDWKGTKSDPVPLFNHSCVQGSSVGSILYNLYTQDLNAVTNCHCICFADDVNLILSHDDPNKLMIMMNKELNKVSNYMRENTLLVNHAKSVHLIFKPKKGKRYEIREKLMMDETEIMRVKNTSFLGSGLMMLLNLTSSYK